MFSPVGLLSFVLSTSSVGHYAYRLLRKLSAVHTKCEHQDVVCQKYAWLSYYEKGKTLSQLWEKAQETGKLLWLTIWISTFARLL